MGWFDELTETRDIGFAAGPITFTEIDAFARLLRVEMLPSEVRLIRRLDAIARNAWATPDGQSPGSADPTKKMIPVSDEAAIELFFRRLEAQQAAVEAPTKAETEETPVE